MALNVQATVTNVTASALIYTGPGILLGLQLATDGVNDPTITAWDGVAAAGNGIVPATEFESDYKGLNGFTTSYGKKFEDGLYIEISGAGTVEVAVDWRAF